MKKNLYLVCFCPKGWHVPSDAEWTELTDYVSCQSGLSSNLAVRRAKF